MMGEWTVFSNHGHVLVCLAKNNDARLKDVAITVGITERAVQKIVRELQEAGFVAITKYGRCNRYRINSRKPLRHEIEAQCTIGKLLQLVAGVRISDKPAEGAGEATGQETADARPEVASSSEKEATRKSPPPIKAPAKAAEGASRSAKPQNKEVAKKDAPEKKPDPEQQGSLF